MHWSFLVAAEQHIDSVLPIPASLYVILIYNYGTMHLLCLAYPCLQLVRDLA